MSYYDYLFGDSYDVSVPEDVEEVQSDIRYRDNTVPLDLITPLEDPYAQQYPNYPDHGYGVDEEQPLENPEVCYPVTVSYETDRTFCHAKS